MDNEFLGLLMKCTKVIQNFTKVHLNPFRVKNNEFVKNVVIFEIYEVAKIRNFEIMNARTSCTNNFLTPSCAVKLCH